MVSLWLAVALAQDAVVCGRGAAPPATVTCDASLLSDALTLIPPGGTVHLYGDIVDPVTATQSFTLVGIPDGTGTLPEWSTRSADLFTVDCGGACVIELSNLLMDSNGERAVVLGDGGGGLHSRSRTPTLLRRGRSPRLATWPWGVGESSRVWAARCTM